MAGELKSYRAVISSDGSISYEELTDTWRPVTSPAMVSEAQLATHTALSDAHHSKSHASEHSEGGSDPISSIGLIHLTGHIYAGAEDTYKGINKEVIIPDVGTLKFRKGIMYEFTPVTPP